MNKSIGLLKTITNFDMPTQVNITGPGKNNVKVKIGIGADLLKSGIEFNLARWYPDRAKQFFIWAAENCIIPKDTFDEWTKISQFDEIAVGYLWRGYALLMLGNYSEACELLMQVPIYFNKFKLTGCEVWQVYEPNLVKALLPLCKYKLNHAPENMEKARKGLEDYIKSFREPKFKLEALLYYYHLREMFPDVYADGGGGRTTAAMTPEPSPVAGLSPEEVEGKGAVVVYDPTGYLEIFGTPKELVQFVQKVGKLSDYRLLSNLLDYYNMENTPGMGPVELEKECVRLLEQTDDEWLREKTESLLDVARESQQEGGENIVLYLDPDIRLNGYEN